ncbi:MAG: hypothetical protein KGL71_10125 [Xanthomonadaceae bacterium]|nr:hypothetical protein [Xanthomonadaceae bacterium]
MQFRSPNGDPIPVSNTLGHSAIVTGEWQTLPEILHRAAMAAGCECDQTRVTTVAPKAESAKDAPKRPANETEVIREAIELMLARRDDPDFSSDFTADQTPNAKIVAKLCGMNVSKEAVMNVFVAMQNEASE